MGLLQKACETYDCFQSIAGVYQADKEVLTPVGHSLTRAAIEITLDAEGHFITARRVEQDEPKIIIPVTEASANRTSSPAAHPLCEQLGYLIPTDKKRFSLYVTQLQKWAESDFTHPILKAVLTYVQGATIVEDLVATSVVKAGASALKDEAKSLVCWIVLGLDSQEHSECWKNRELMQLFTSYYREKTAETTQKQVCMVTGEQTVLSDKHAKGIVPTFGNAKVISSNDSSNFTYRGRFADSWQAATIGYEASQKAHNALRWLIADQSVRTVYGGRVYLCWNPQGRAVPSVASAFRRRNRDDAPKAVDPTDYRQQLQAALTGWKTELPDESGVVIASFDAATSGRLALTYYNELMASDFLQRLYHWDATCCWPNGSFGVQSPYLKGMIERAYGTWSGTGWLLDDRILKQQMQRIIHCRVSGALFPADLKNALVQHASNLHLLTSKESNTLLFYTCAAIRKYHYDTTKEEYAMALDTNNTDRSYLFGRLLAVAEAVERSTYQNGDERETNAMRMQTVFSQRPMYAWRILEERLLPYYARLNPALRSYFKRTVEEIVEKLPMEDGSLNRKLEDTYLIGYYHQRAYRKNKTTEAQASDSE